MRGRGLCEGVVCGDVTVLQRMVVSVSHGDDGGQVHQRAATVCAGRSGGFIQVNRNSPLGARRGALSQLTVCAYFGGELNPGRYSGGAS